ncbi:hypothetical protein V8C35DRAFT_327474 [Trichoderma chlorosporum]
MGKGLYRTPKWHWPLVPNLPADEETASMREENHKLPIDCDVQLAKPWFINPKAFTVMTACTDDQRAREICHDGVHRGAFTHGLLEYLKDNNYYVTYRMAQDYLREKLSPQTPTIHGQDRFLFFGHSEPLYLAPVRVNFDGKFVSIPIGRAHGFHEGTEFMPFHPTSGPTLFIDSVKECKSTIRRSDGMDQILKKCDNIITESRLSLGKDYSLRLLLDSNFKSGFRDELQQFLQRSIVNEIGIGKLGRLNGNNAHHGPGADTSTISERLLKLFHEYSIRRGVNESQNIEIAKGLEDTDRSTATVVEFKLLQRDDQKGTEIIGAESLGEYSRSIRIKSNIEYPSKETHAAEVALSLIHMVRFEHTLRLQPQQRDKNHPPFTVSLAPMGKWSETNIYPANQRFKYTFCNTGNEDLHMALLDMTSGLCIQQIYPNDDSQDKVIPGNSVNLIFTTCIPVLPPDFEHLGQSSHPFRDTLRTLVSTEGSISWKVLEMTDIWEAGKLKTTEIEVLEERNMKIELEASEDIELVGVR